MAAARAPMTAGQAEAGLVVLREQIATLRVQLARLENLAAQLTGEQAADLANGLPPEVAAPEPTEAEYLSDILDAQLRTETLLTEIRDAVQAGRS